MQQQTKNKMKKSMTVFLFSSFVVFLSIKYFDFLAAFTWSVWIFSVIVEQQDRCFFRNPFLAKLFTTIEESQLDKASKIPATPVKIIEAKDYSLRALEVLSNSWTQPVIVRGLFNEAPALKKWTNPDYLISRTFGKSTVSVIHNGTIAKHYDMVCGTPSDAETFSEYKEFDRTIRNIANGSIETIVFPPASRSKRIREREVEEKWNEMVKEDIDLSKIGSMFDQQARSTILTQMFLGGGVSPDSAEKAPVIGTGWHGDICNNFVVQISGVKKWVMIDPKYSKYLRPVMRAGKTAIVGAHLSIETDTLPYLPHHEFLLYPGDMLYNPEWYWHSIHNLPEGPYAFGLVSRQCHLVRNFRQSFLFTSLVIANHAKAMIFDVEARMRIMGLLFGTSLMRPEEGVNVAAQNEVRGGYT